MPKKLKKPRPGEIFSAGEPFEQDRLDRLSAREAESEQKQKTARRIGKPRSGEVLEAATPASEFTDEGKVRAFLTTALARFKLAAEAEASWRKDALDDFEFRIGKQWPSDIQTQRGIDGRPCLTMNRLPQFIRQVTNEQRQQRPAGQINPTSDGADTDTAEILQGCIRHVEVNSDADVAYDTAFDHAVTGGLGWWRVMTDYVDDDSDDQDIFLKPIRNPFIVYDDPAAIELDRSDAQFRFVIEDVPISEYKERYKDTESATLNDFSSIGDQAPEWATRDTIRVAEYFYVEEKTDERGRTKTQVKWAKINAVEIIDGNDNRTAGRDLAGKWIPLVPVIGDEVEVNGKRHIAGLVRNAKDPQRMYNYWVSAATEMIALAPKAPFIGAEGQFENHEAEWQQANVRNLAKLEYKPVSVGGQAVGPPQRQQFEPPIQSINLMTMQADNDMKATTGIYDPSLGKQGPEQSGKAILARQKQSDVTTLNFSDNLARSIRHSTRIILDLIPKIYDTAKVQRIINPDQSIKHVGLFNSKEQDKEEAFEYFRQNHPGIDKVYDIGVGRYDVSVSVGPSYQSKRQEAVASIMSLIQAFPEIMGAAGDLLVGEMDWNGAKEISKRLKKMLPPNLQDDQDQSPEAQVTRLSSQLQQVTQQAQLTSQALAEAKQIIDAKQTESQAKIQIAQMENQTKLALATMQKETTIGVAEITSKAQDALKRAQIEADLYKQFHISSHDLASQHVAQSHEKTLQSMQQEHEQSLAETQAEAVPSTQ